MLEEVNQNGCVASGAVWRMIKAAPALAPPSRACGRLTGSAAECQRSPPHASAGFLELSRHCGCLTGYAAECLFQRKMMLRLKLNWMDRDFFFVNFVLKIYRLKFFEWMIELSS